MIPPLLWSVTHISIQPYGATLLGYDNNYSTNNMFYKWTEQSEKQPNAEKHGLHVGHNWILNKNWIELFYVKNCPKYNLNYLIAITLRTEVDYLH